MAKNHNALGEVNSIMRSFARICVSLDSGLANRLEAVMNSEISIDYTVKEQAAETKYPVNPMMLAQADFMFLSAPEKLARLEYYKSLRSELERTRDLRSKLVSGASDNKVYATLTSSLNEVENIMNEVESNQENSVDIGLSSIDDNGVIGRLKKTMFSVDSLVG
jgi:hypothetical protein